jgi:uroporphyrinogen-III synthase
MNDLNGLQVLVTRPEPQASALCQQIAERGGQGMAFPTIAFAGPPQPKAFEEAIKLTGEQDWLIFISPQAVLASVPAIRRAWPTFPPEVQFAAVGRGTARSLQEAGYHALYPDDWRSEGLLAMPVFQAIENKKIAIVRGHGGRELIDDTLRARGADILTVIAYQRILPQVNVRKTIDEVQQQKINVIICTSYESVHNLKMMLGDHGWSYIKDILLIVVSERIKRLADDLGFQTIWVARNASAEALLDRLADVRK